ncbi:hypothetical protein JDN40_02285 [Rhodomicrobium vannielii ATCC 17100]|uniref:hypothetical protein n=1 Tax=Rhodomicrobium vannielii TaxID=1069 RepID=UPI00191A8BF1|nr:hypothetical protein [Rhodomicrobium vannielii]MBJ7532943.1 hypothetical protein [Rhodomicrobium vannielii ATCC 17100]
MRKASEAVALALNDAKFGNAAASFRDLLAVHVQSQIATIPDHQLANMSVSASRLSEIATNVVADALSQIPPERREAVQRGDSLKPGETAMILTLFGLPRGVMAFTGERKGETGDGTLPKSSARLDLLVSKDSPEYWRTPEGQAAMTAYACTLGLSWARSVPELLRMGPEAIKALADVHLRKETYTGLRGIAGFEKEQVLALAKAAHEKEKNFDANEAGRLITEANKGLSAEEKRRHNEALVGVMKAPRGPEGDAAWRHYEEVHKKLRANHPENGKALDRSDDFMRDQVRQTRKYEARAEAIQTRAEATELRANAKEVEKEQKTAAAQADIIERNKAVSDAQTADASFDDMLSGSQATLQASTKSAESPYQAMTKSIPATVASNPPAQTEKAATSAIAGATEKVQQNKPAPPQTASATQAKIAASPT